MAHTLELWGTRGTLVHIGPGRLKRWGGDRRGGSTGGSAEGTEAGRLGNGPGTGDGKCSHFRDDEQTRHKRGRKTNAQVF